MTTLAIVPGRAIGPFRLEMTPDEVAAAGGGPEATAGGGDEYVRWNYPGITVWFDDARAVIIAAQPGADAATADGIAVGMPWPELLRIVPDVSFSEDLWAFVSPQHPGMMIRAARPPGPEDVRWNLVVDGVVEEILDVEEPELVHVRSISVFAP